MSDANRYGGAQSGVFLTHDPGLRYLLGVPQEIKETTPVVACVHGFRREVQEQFRAFAPLAEQTGCLLLAPLFAVDVFRDYQRLGRPGKGGRADLSLLELIAHLKSSFRLRAKAIRFYGHSGGGQFVHRFAMAHPECVARYALSAPGWYTFPDESLAYPYGLAGAAEQGMRLYLDDFLKIPGAVFVGSADRHDGPTLRHNPTVDEHQGAHRLERALRWTGTVNARAKERGLREPLTLRQLPNGAHNFRGLVRNHGLHEQVWGFLTSAAESYA